MHPKMSSTIIFSKVNTLRETVISETGWLQFLKIIYSRERELQVAEISLGNTKQLTMFPI